VNEQYVRERRVNEQSNEVDAQVCEERVPGQDVQREPHFQRAVLMLYWLDRLFLRPWL